MSIKRYQKIRRFVASEFFIIEDNTIDHYKAYLMGYILSLYKQRMGVCMKPWLGLLNAYVPSYFQFVKNHAT